MAIATAQQFIDIIRIFAASVYATLIWDWLESLHREYIVIWRAEWSALKAAYLFNRYYGIVRGLYCIPTKWRRVCIPANAKVSLLSRKQGAFACETCSAVSSCIRITRVALTPLHPPRSHPLRLLQQHHLNRDVPHNGPLCPWRLHPRHARHGAHPRTEVLRHLGQAALDARRAALCAHGRGWRHVLRRSVGAVRHA